jgi:hypothetical protein
MCAASRSLQELSGVSFALQERLADEVKRLKLSVLLQHPNQEVALKQRTAGAVAQVRLS